MNHRTLHVLIGVHAAALCTAGCRLAYLPPSAQAPMFTHAGQATAAALTGNTSLEAQIAYSPIDHVGVLGSGMYDYGDAATSHNRYRYADLLGEYYTSNTDGIRFELMGGIGRGESKPVGDLTHGTHAEGAYFRYVLQGNIGYSNLNDAPPDGEPDHRFLIEFATVLRVAYVDFDRLDQIDYETSDLQGMPLPPITPLPHRSTISYEPAFILRLGTPLLQAETQCGLARATDRNRDFDVNPLYISLGLRLALR